MKTETPREQPVFETRLTSPAPHGLRITLTLESTSDEGMEWALVQAICFARARMMGVAVSHKGDPTTRASCRTTKLRKRVKTNAE